MTLQIELYIALSLGTVLLIMNVVLLGVVQKQQKIIKTYEEMFHD